MRRALDYMICAAMSAFLIYAVRTSAFTVQETIVCTGAYVSYIVIDIGHMVTTAIERKKDGMG